MSDCLYCYPETYPKQAHMIVGTICTIYCPVIVTVNVALIVSFVATKQSTQNTSNLLIVCLSVSDCLIGVIVMPMIAAESFWINLNAQPHFMPVSMTLQSFLGGTSLGMTMLLAMDRYLHMNPDIQRIPSRFAKLFKIPRVYLMILACVAFFAAISISPCFTVKFARIAIYFEAFHAIIVFLMLSIFVTTYTRGYLRVRRFVAENPIYRDRESNGNPEYLETLFKTVLLLIIAVVVSWLPVLVLKISGTILGFVYYIDMPNSFILFSKIVQILFFTTSFVNTLIIFSCNTKSKKWLKKCIRSCRSHRNGDEIRSADVDVEMNRVKPNSE